MLGNIIICHLTSVHKRYDTRIFIKECKSLSKYYEVNLVVADGKGDEIKNGINIYDVGKLDGRLNRMFKTTRMIFKKAVELNCDIYHLHDPELIPIGLKLKKLGKKVIFDAHEDFPKQLLGKSYLNKSFLKILSKAFGVFEKYACKKFDYIVTATQFIRDKFLKININSININNFPILSELSNKISQKTRKKEVCYIGDLTLNRGIKEIVKAMEYTKNITLNLGGSFSEKDIENKVKNLKGWTKVKELGFLNRDGVAKVLANSKAGLVTLYPIINYQDALPVKMFEYMSAGLPVIASNFSLWETIIEGNNCGICVNPLDPKEIAKAIEYIMENPVEAGKMGKNGRKTVEEKYNWTKEENKLLEIYNQLIKKKRNDE
jgi:glycosyltransferase involved in cell wall biosynthesis